MQLEHSFSVPVGIDEAWRILLDIERIGPCMPGAAIDSVEGDDFTGTVKVKLGPINLTYKGKASFVEKDEAAHRAVIDARGKDARGNGTAAAKVTAVLTETGAARTTVKVNTDLDITGKPAQFGRGVMVDVGNKLIGQFADSLAGTIAAGDGGSERADAAGTAGATKAPAKRTRPKPVKAAPPDETSAPVGEAVTLAGEPPTEPPAPADSPLPAVELAADEPAAAEPPATIPNAVSSVSSVNGHSAATAGPLQREVEPINLLESAGPAVAKRIAPVAVAVVVVLLGVRRRRSKRNT
ncbi:MAG: SRPBCC family protein [Jatrophihabitans sp.]|uniref:SRPBCC family protein n=1 Tax=Jatrophihabitans sp. TaxID=1932789 RepID=UPI00391111D6